MRSVRTVLRQNRYLLLALVLIGQAGLSLRLLWSNTAFQDEALYLRVGHLELSGWLHGTPVPELASYLSGAPVVYPPLGAMADDLGGLATARLLSLVFMLGSTALLFAVTRRIFSARAGLGAAAVFAVLGPVQVLGAFATYDAMAVFLLALATWCAVRASGRLGELWLVAAALAMGLADAAKYASLLWNPIIIGVAVLAVPGPWLRSSLRGVRLVLYAGSILAVALLGYGGPAYVHGLLYTTLLRQGGGTPTAVGVILHDSFDWVGIVLVLAIGGTAAAFRSASLRIRLLALLLTVAIVLAPADEARLHILTSLHKHVAYGAWFAAIVAGYALERVMETWRVRDWLVIAVASVAALAGAQQAAGIFHSWPDTTRMIAALRPLTSPSTCPCLFSEDRVVSYYLPAQTATAKVAGPYAFSYWSRALQHEVSGIAAYQDAIAAHYFGVVELDADEEKTLYKPILLAMEAAHGYRLTEVTPSNLPGEPIVIWRYTGLGGAAPGQQAALTRELHFPRRQVPVSPLGGLLTPAAILRPFLANVTVALVGTGLFVLMLMLVIRLCWRRGKAAEEI